MGKNMRPNRKSINKMLNFYFACVYVFERVRIVYDEHRKRVQRFHFGDIWNLL